jgi:hypothetical protein
MPATIITLRPTFTDSDALPPAVFNSVTFVSGYVPDANGASEGVIRLAGDLGGSASSPQLTATGATAGTYGTTGLKVATFTVDAKGRMTASGERDLPLPDAAAGTKGVVQLAGDLTGTAASPQLAATGVTAGTYGSASSVPVFTIDAKGRITGVTPTAIPATPDAAAGTKGVVQLAGDLTGTAASPQLAATGITAGSYGSSTTLVQLTVDAKGRIIGIGQVNIPAPTGAASAFVAFDGVSTASFRAGLAYSRASNVVTVTAPAHGFRVGDRVGVDFTSGTSVTDGLYAVASVPDANSFTFAHTGVNTGGNLTLEIFETRNTFNVHSVVKDRRTATGSYWVNFQNALNNDTYLVTGNADHVAGSYIAVLMLSTTAGVRSQDTRGCSVHVYEPAVGAVNPNNASVVIHGG